MDFAAPAPQHKGDELASLGHKYFAPVSLGHKDSEHVSLGHRDIEIIVAGLDVGLVKVALLI